MSDNWVVQNLENALNTWNTKLGEIWGLLTQTPETFKGGGIWKVILRIHIILFLIRIKVTAILNISSFARFMNSFNLMV